MPLRTLRHAAAQLATAVALTLLTPAAQAQAPFPPDDCGDTRETARPISPGQTIQGRFDAKGFLVPDVDVYRVEAPVGRLVKFTLDFIDPRDFLFDDPSRFNTNYDNTSPIGSTIVRSLTATNQIAVTESPFYVNVIHPSRPDGTPVRYTLTATDTGPVPPPLATNTPDNPELLQPNVWYTVPTVGRGSPWWVGIPVLAGQAVAFDRERTRQSTLTNQQFIQLVFGSPTRSSGYLYPETPYSTMLRGNTAPANGNVITQVDWLAGERVRLRFVAPPQESDANTFATPTPLTFTDSQYPLASIQDTFQSSSDADSYTMQLQQGQRLVINGAGGPDQGPFELRLIDPSGVTLVQANVGSFYPYLPVIPIERTGLHRLILTSGGWSSTPSNYALTININQPIPGADPRGFIPLVLDGPWVPGEPFANSDTQNFGAIQTFGFVSSVHQYVRLRVEAESTFWPYFTIYGRYPIEMSPPFGPGGAAVISGVIRVETGSTTKFELVARYGSTGTFRVRLESFTPSDDDLPNSNRDAPLVPIGQAVPARYDYVGDVDVARFELVPGRLYGSLTTLSFPSEVARSSFEIYQQPRFYYSVDRPTLAYGAVSLTDGYLGVQDFGPVPAGAMPMAQTFVVGQPLIVPAIQSDAKFDFPAFAQAGKVYEITSSPSTYSTVLVSPRAPWNYSSAGARWFNTPTAWGNTELEARVGSGPARTFMLSEVAAPARLIPGIDRQVPVGQIDWAYTDGGDDPGCWTVDLSGGRVYQILTTPAAGLFSRQATPPPADFVTLLPYPSFNQVPTFATSAPRTIRIAGPQPGSAASIQVVDRGPAPEDDVPSPAQAPSLDLGANVNAGRIDFRGDVDWFTVASNRPRMIRVSATASSGEFLSVSVAKPFIDAYFDTAVAWLVPGEAATVRVASFPRGDSSPLLSAPIPYSVTVSFACDADIAGANQSLTPDGQLTADDLIVFLNAYLAGEPRGDIAGFNQDPYPDNQFTADDLIVYINAFFAGC